MAEQKQRDQLQPTYSSSVRIPDVTKRTCQKQLTIGRSGERRSRISMQGARQDNDDDLFPRLNKTHAQQNYIQLQETD